VAAELALPVPELLSEAAQGQERGLPEETEVAERKLPAVEAPGLAEEVERKLPVVAVEALGLVAQKL
jgi:hypothetical protein